MRGLLRIALTWLLALALPVQGYAAHAMLFCGPAHHPPAVAVAAAGHDDHAAHGHAAGSPAAHGVQAGAQDDADDRQGVAAEPASKAQPAKSSHAKCSICASCCGMTAIAGSDVGMAAVRLPPAYAPAPFEPHDGRTAGGLERPPKAHLA